MDVDRSSGSVLRNETDQVHVMHVRKDGMTLSFETNVCVSAVNIPQTCPGMVRSRSNGQAMSYVENALDVDGGNKTSQTKAGWLAVGC